MPYKDKEKQRQYGREWIAKRRAEWLAEHGPCIKCGTWENLQLDHIDPTQKIDHKIWSWAEERRLAELAKCQVLCKQCHKEKSQLEQRKIPPVDNLAWCSGCQDFCVIDQFGPDLSRWNGLKKFCFACLKRKDWGHANRNKKI